MKTVYIIVLLITVVMASGAMPPIATAEPHHIDFGAETEVELVTQFDNDEAAKDLKRRIPPIPLFVTEEHHGVLKAWFKEAQAPTKTHDLGNVIPSEDVTVIHIDSHPDLSLPKPFSRHIPKKAAKLERDNIVDIASFQLAAVWAGLVDHVMWIRPPWAHQIDDVSYKEGYIGLDSGKFRVSMVDMYWCFNNRSLAVEQMTGPPRKWHMSVTEIGILLKEDSPPPIGPWILDIDEDYFGTYNPECGKLQIMFNTTGDLPPAVKHFVDVWKRENVCLNTTNTDDSIDYDSITSASDALKRTLKALVAKELYSKPIVEFLKGTQPIIDLFCGDLGTVAMRAMYDAINETLTSTPTDDVKERKRKVYDLIVSVHSSANLPHSPTPTAETTNAMILDVLTLIRKWARAGSFPSLITFSRSILDGFTPIRTWVQVEDVLIKGITAIYSPYVTYPPNTTNRKPVRVVYDDVESLSVKMERLDRAPPGKWWPASADGMDVKDIGVRSPLPAESLARLSRNGDFAAYSEWWRDEGSDESSGSDSEGPEGLLDTMFNGNSDTSTTASDTE